MKQFHELLDNIESKGVWKESARENMPRTLSLFGTRMEFDMKDGFPLLTTKKMYTKAIFVELLWFLKGDTNIKYLVDNGCNIWNQDAYRWYLKQCELNGKDVYYKTIDSFIERIKKGYLPKEWKGLKYTVGDLGKVYGQQWRNQNGIDQINEVIEGIKANPYSRYHIIDAWQKSDFNDMALPPCHLLYQFNCRKIEEKERVELLNNTNAHKYVKEGELVDEANIPLYYLDLQMYQRSCDTFLGVPFNIASASLLLNLVAKTVNMMPSKFVWVGGDTHIYENHLEQVDKILGRNYDKHALPDIEISKDLNSIKDLENLTVEDIKVLDYESYPTIKAELKTGL